MDKLEPCPFCGCEPIFATKFIEQEKGIVTLNFEISCRSCLAKPSGTYGSIKFFLTEYGSISTLKDEREKAISKWNRRENSKDI